MKYGFLNIPVVDYYISRLFVPIRLIAESLADFAKRYHNAAVLFVYRNGKI